VRSARGRPGSGARIGGDPGPLVAGHDRLVEDRSPVGDGLDAEQDGQEVVQEQGAAQQPT
jgi:hypothetical protein